MIKLNIHQEEKEKPFDTRDSIDTFDPLAAVENKV